MTPPGPSTRLLSLLEQSFQQAEAGEAAAWLDTQPEIAALPTRHRQAIDALLQTHYDQLRAATWTDPLTGLLNRLAFEDCLQRSARLATRQQQGWVLALFDLDDFKSINDRFGHPAGDRALCAWAAKLKETLRSSDTLARIGGDEFAAILPGVEEVDVSKLSKRLGNITVQIEDSRILTTSVGLLWIPATADKATPDDLVARADRLLYKDKGS